MLMDIVVVSNKNGEKEKMEVVTIFDIPNYEFHYIIYRSLDGKDYYVAKYSGENVVNLITDLDSTELEYANGILRSVLKGVVE